MPVKKKNEFDLNDARIGHPNGKEPTVCAVSGQSVRGRHQEQHQLRSGFYYSVLAKFKGRIPPTRHAELMAVLPPEPTPAPEPESADAPNTAPESEVAEVEASEVPARGKKAGR
jgi:hypothetical protein